MGRRKKTIQDFNFPSDNQPSLSDAEIDATIDGTVPGGPVTPLRDFTKKTTADKTEKIKKDNTEKKEATQAVKDIPEIFSPDQVAWVLDCYVVAMSFVFSIVMKAEYKIIYEELKLDDEVKAAWSKPLAKIISKHAPSQWAYMTAEIELIGCLAIYSVTGFQRARVAVQRENEKKQQEEAEKRAVGNTQRNRVAVNT